jgi:putative ABC transport system permease protein
MRDLLREGLRGLAAHRARSFLSALGILFGVAAVIGILSIGEGARQEEEQLISQLGILNVQVAGVELPEDEEALLDVLRRTQGLSRRDVDVFRAMMPGLAHVGGLRELEPAEVFPKPVSGLDGLRFVGIEPGHLAGSPFTLYSGRPLRLQDERNHAGVCLVGMRAAQVLFGGLDVLGEKVRVNDAWLTVVGVVNTGTGGESRLEGLDIFDRSGDVMMPLSTSMKASPPELNQPELTEVQLTFEEVEGIPPRVDLIQRTMARRHRNQKVYELVVPLKLIEQSAAQQRIFNLVMGLIAGISLLVGGIGIMNIMLASVLERTKEIAIRLAVGASPQDIHRLFLMEACLISLLGGLLGIAAGYGVSWVVALFTGWATSVSLQAVLLATVVSTLEGLVFGYLPARRAAKMQPAMAVRM